MIRKSFAVTAVLAALVVPAFADVPDGHGGRTSPQGLNRPALAAGPVHMCCDAVAPRSSRAIVSSPAELKALGHVARVARNGDPVPTAPCYKRVARRPARYGSPAELKALGHVAAGNGAHATGVATCCETGRCPMRPKATASR